MNGTEKFFQDMFMIVEIATVADAEHILSLQKKAYRSEAEIYDDYSILPLTQTIEELKKDFDSNVFLKAVIDGKMIGSVRAFEKEGTCYIGRLIVHPDLQDRGIGTKLLCRIEETFATSDRFELYTGDRSEKNIYLYEKLGYRAFKTEKVNARLTFIFFQKRRVNPAYTAGP